MPWRTPTRIVFRFVFCYFALYCLYVFSFEEQIFKFALTGRFADTWVDLFWHHLVPWFATHILRLAHPITVFSNGSGDTTYDYVLILFELLLAAVATLVWSALDRTRPNYRRLHEWLRFVVRVLLAGAMLAYGMDKLIPVQFGSMTLGRLATRVGDLTPFRMLWTFMAASKSYTIFAGSAEVLAGLLLLIPRLTTLGALVAMAAMANVFALNMSYDVPVKLFSLHFFLMALFLVVPDVERLLSVLVLNRPALPRESTPLSARRWVNQTTVILSTVLGLMFLALLTKDSVKRYREENPPASASRPALYGVWTVDEFAVSSDASRPLFTTKLASDLSLHPGEDRWSELIVQRSDAAQIRLLNGVLDAVTLKLDETRNRASISDPADPNWKCDFAYQPTGDQRLTMQGQINGDPVSMKLHRIDRPNSILMSRGFHWINERPF